jgi:O-antigen/teichoic acid export membrane protein
MMLGTALIALGLERKWLLVGLVACVVSPTLNFIGIPLSQNMWDNGGIGAAAAAVATETVMLLGALLLLPRGVVDLRSLSWLAARILIAATPFVVMTRILLAADIHLIIALIPGGVLFLAGGFLLRVVTISEVRNLRGLATRMVRSKLGR